jgi:hypothetical protein
LTKNFLLTPNIPLVMTFSAGFRLRGHWVFEEVMGRIIWEERRGKGENQPRKGLGKV